MGQDDNRSDRLTNLWVGLARKAPTLARCSSFLPHPNRPIDRVAGLARARDEILTHAAAITSPEVYARWGTAPAVGLLLIGGRGSGKSTLARALATRLGAPLLEIDVPQLVLELLTRGAEVAQLVDHWEQLFDEFPKTVIHFDELDFERMHETGERKAGLPAGPILEFLLRLVGQTASSKGIVLVGSTSYPQTVRPVFLSRRRFTRTLKVEPIYPGDHAAVLELHARSAEERAGRPLFETIDWNAIASARKGLSPGNWVEALHGALRCHARREAIGESPPLVAGKTVLEEAETLAENARATHAEPASGNYL